MKRNKLLLILPLVFGLVVAGYFLVNYSKAQAVGEDDEGIEGVGEASELGEKAEKLLEKLEKKELPDVWVPSSLVITAKGKTTLVNVDLTAVATTTTGTTTGATLTIKIFGLSFTVDASGARIIGGGKELSVSDLKAGDKLLIKGVIDESTGVIKASRIQDRTIQKEAISGLRGKIQELMNLIKELRLKLKGQ